MGNVQSENVDEWSKIGTEWKSKRIVIYVSRQSAPLTKRLKSSINLYQIVYIILTNKSTEY